MIVKTFSSSIHKVTNRNSLFKINLISASLYSPYKFTERDEKRPAINVTTDRSAACTSREVFVSIDELVNPYTDRPLYW